MPTIAVVTDSSAGLLPAEALTHGIVVEPLQLMIGGRSYRDGVDEEADAASVAAALREFLPVSTSRPSPEIVLQTYRRLADQGAEEIVSVHLSGEMSATLESAQLAARQSPVPVHCVDSRQVAFATGYAAVAAAAAIVDGADGSGAAKAARVAAERCTSLFYVDTLEYLRRSGRVGALGAMLGSALAVKPLLTVQDGRIVPLEKVRTGARALARLEELAVQAAEGHEVSVTVCHLAAEEAATALAERLADRLRVQPVVREVPAVIGAHVGPGLVGAVVSRH